MTYCNCLRKNRWKCRKTITWKNTDEILSVHENLWSFLTCSNDLISCPFQTGHKAPVLCKREKKRQAVSVLGVSGLSIYYNVPIIGFGCWSNGWCFCRFLSWMTTLLFNWNAVEVATQVGPPSILIGLHLTGSNGRIPWFLVRFLWRSWPGRPKKKSAPGTSSWSCCCSVKRQAFLCFSSFWQYRYFSPGFTIEAINKLEKNT